MKIIISQSSDSPIYEQIKEQIKCEIISGELQQGELLPSIRSLAKELNISVITTKRAYEELDRDGFIETVRGKGCYVSFQNRDFIIEQKRRKIETQLLEVIRESKSIGITSKELCDIIQIFYDKEI